MYTNNFEQIVSFFIFTVVGALISIIFDLFRILRKTFKTPDWLTYIEDCIFWIIAGTITLYSIFVFNNGELRLYIFIGITIGVLLYILLISKYFIKINVLFISYIKALIQKIMAILCIPIKFLLSTFRKLILQPISFVFINIRGFMTKIFNKFMKIRILNKKVYKNKGI